ncbi:MAG TPA: SOS response-associated peptidase [Actinotalea sp.]|nr:SOS response-associated peptidase [Actinotalea sp.]
MCGRYAAFRAAQDLADAFGVDDDDIAADARALPPSWNVAPTDPVRIVVERPERDGGEPRRSLRLARWGLVPSWAADPSGGARLINARFETLDTKPAFRGALASRRCLVPADGYFEWTDPPAGSPRGTPRQPHWIHPADGGPLAFAGLYAFWRDRTRADDDPLRWLVSTTIVTGAAWTADPAVAALHDRRPVVLDRGRWDAWLDPGHDGAAALPLLRDPPPDLVATTVSTAVNRVGTQGPELVEPV